MSAPYLHDAARALTEWWDWAGAPADPWALRQAAPAPARPETPAAAAVSTPQAQSNATEIAAACANLEALETAIRDFDGCALKRTAKSTVVFDGVQGAPFLLVGEAPGREEDELGKPFVGRSGRLLDRMLGAVGLSRSSNVLISNVIYWRPPGNRPPTPAETALCLPFVRRAITLADPKVLILCGGSAAKAVLGREDAVSRMRGRRLTLSVEGRQINTLVILHPAYLLRRPQEKRLAWADLLLLETWAEELALARDAAL